MSPELPPEFFRFSRGADAGGGSKEGVKEPPYNTCNRLFYFPASGSGRKSGSSFHFRFFLPSWVP